MSNYVIILVASILAGATNAIAGGGTLITFPALVWVGINPLSANITNTVALWTGSVTGAWGFKERLVKTKHLLKILIFPSLFGGILGAYLLMITPYKVFNFVVPFLVLFATIILALNDRINKFNLKEGEDIKKKSLVFVFILQFLTSLYGGYFAAGIGILMLATLGIAGITDIHTANGIKNLLSLFINVTSGLVLLFSGKVVWPFAFILMIGFALGGYWEAKVSQRFDNKKVKNFVVLWGIALAIAFWVRGV
jgi:hypothetical protein